MAKVVICTGGQNWYVNKKYFVSTFWDFKKALTQSEKCTLKFSYVFSTFDILSVINKRF